MQPPMIRNSAGARQHARTLAVPEQAVDRIGDDHRGEGGDGDEAHDAGVEQAGIAPLDGEPERDQRKAGSLDQHAHAIGGAEPGEDQSDEDGKAGEEGERAGLLGHFSSFPLKMPVGRQISTATRMKKGTTILYSVGTKAIFAGISSHSGK